MKNSRQVQPVERAGLSWIERHLSIPLVLHERFLEWEGFSHDVTVAGSCSADTILSGVTSMLGKDSKMSAWLQMHILMVRVLTMDGPRAQILSRTFRPKRRKPYGQRTAPDDGKHRYMQSAGWNGNLCPSCPVFKRQKSEVHWTSPRSSAFFVLTRELHGPVWSGLARSGSVRCGPV